MAFRYQAHLVRSLLESLLIGLRCFLSRLFCAFVPMVSLVLLLSLPEDARATTVDIHAIQVDLPASPYLGQTVTTSGIVIAVLSNGFYIENPSSDFDQNTCSSEGIFVYTPSGVPSNAVSGNSLTVTGLVEASNSSSYAAAQIYIATPVVGSNVVTNSTGNSLPSAISSSVMTQATSGTCSSYSAGAFGQWLPFTGMRVNVPSSSSLLVTQGTGGTVTPASQTATTNGQFWAVFTTTRPFRATGISELDTVPSSAPSTVQRWTGNPQLLLVDTTALGGTALNASATTEYSGSSNLVGIVDYSVSSQGYTGLLLDSTSVSALSKQGGASATAVTTRSGDEITFATQNLESSTGVGLIAGETSRITKLANAIVSYHKLPDVIAVQGATVAALNLLVSDIDTIGGVQYTLYPGTTNLSDGIVDAFLVNLSQFDTTSGNAPATAAVLGTNTYTTTSSTSATLFDRVPLVLTVKIPRTGISDYTMNIVNASLMERTNIDDTTLGPDIRNRREQQAELLSTQVLEPYESAIATAVAADKENIGLMVVGGYDSFEFSDGYVDALGILDGAESTNTSAGSLVTLYDSTYNTTALENTTTTATNLSLSKANPATSRYTYVESGSAEQPDHILINAEMSSLVSIDYARIGADFPVSETYDTTTVARAASHDGIVAYFTVPYPTTTTVVTSLTPSFFDEPVTFTASVVVTGSTVNTVPDGTVTFTDNVSGSTICNAVSLSNGSAACTYSALTVGTHTITAAYSGSETGLGYQSSSGTVSQVVQKDVTTLSLASSLNPSFYGEPVTFTATATSSNGAGGSGNTPSGTVSFFVDGSATASSTCTLSTGACTWTTSTLAVGTHIITASYGGDTTDTTATATLSPNQVVNINATTVTVASSENPSYYGDNVTFTITATGSYGLPTGTVTYYDSTTSTTLGTGTLACAIPVVTGTYICNGGSFSISTLAVGSHVIQATLASNGVNAAGTGTVTQVVNTNTSTLKLTSSENPSIYGDSVTFTVAATALSGTPSGSITFMDGSTTLGTGTLAVGATTYTISTLSVGTHAIQAVYAGDGTHAAATASMSQIVNANTSTLVLSTSANPIYYGNSVTFTVAATALSGTPSGTVEFTVNGAATYAASISSGTATFTTTSLAVGTDLIQVTYGGDGIHGAATSNTISEVVQPVYATISTLSCSPNPAQYLTTVTCTDAVASAGGTPAGTVTFYDGSTSLGTATLVSGVATFATSALSVGSHTLTAVYGLNDPYLGSTSNSVTEIIASTFALTASPTSKTLYTGEAADFTLTVTPGTGFTLDVALVCSGAPANTTCTLTPSTVTGGSGTAKMVIQTTAPQQTTTASNLSHGRGWPLLAGVLLLFIPRRLRRRGKWLLGILVLAAVASMGAISGCGGSGTLTGGTPAGTYTISVVGTANDGTLVITQTANVTLNVESMF